MTAALVLPADRALLSALAQKCEVALKSLLHDDLLDLSHRELDDRDAPAIGALLRANAALEELNLSHNALGDRGTVSLVEKLREDRTCSITYLGLEHNGIGSRGGTAIATLVPGLRVACIEGNAISDSTATALRAREEGGVFCDQFENLANFRAHKDGTGAEICEQLEAQWGMRPADGSRTVRRHRVVNRAATLAAAARRSAHARAPD